MPENFGRSIESLPAIDRGAMDQQVAFDVYPYVAGSTVLIPERLRQDVPVQITWSMPHPEMSGRMLDSIAKEWGISDREAARAPATCRRDLLPNGRGRRPTHHDPSPRNDRQ